MKIYNDFLYSGFRYNYRKDNNYQTNNYINFSGRNFKTIAKSSHLIDNSISASLDLPLQDIVESIYKKLRGLKQYFEKNNFQKTFEMRSKYPFIESKPILRGGYSFSLFEGDEKGKTISIVRSKNASDILRLVVTENGDENKSTHFLIKGLDKVVANLNQKYPFVTPPKLRFMTAKELTDSGVIKYIKLVEHELDKYYSFLQGGPDVSLSGQQNQTAEVAPKKRMVSESVMRVTKSQAEMTERIFDIFDSTAEVLPKHVSPQISPSSGKVLIITLPTEDGASLRVSKTMNPEYGDKLRYISVAKTMSDGTKKFLAIDTHTKKFLKTDSKTGKPIVPDGEPLFYSTNEVEKGNLKEFFEETYNQIFREAKAEEIVSAEEVTVLKTKEQVKVIDLDEIEAEPLDFEDKKLNAIMDKSAKEEVENVEPSTVTQVVTPKKRGRKPKALSQTADTTEVVTPKRRGRKPKIKSETVEPTTTPAEVSEGIQTSPKAPIDLDVDKTVDIEQIRQRIIQKAEEDAEKLSQLYVETLFAKLKENIGKAFDAAMEKFAELLKN